MKNIELSENDLTFVHYVLRYYANHVDGLEAEDKHEIYELSNKFK